MPEVEPGGGEYTLACWLAPMGTFPPSDDLVYYCSATDRWITKTL